MTAFCNKQNIVNEVCINILLPVKDMDRIYLWGINFHTVNTRELILISFKENRQHCMTVDIEKDQSKG